MIAPETDYNLDIFEFPPDAVATHLWQMVDATHYGRMNAAHAIFLGRNRKDAEYASVYDLFSQAEADALVAQNQPAFTSRNPSFQDIWLQNAGHERRLLRIIRTPILGQDGEVLFLSCSAEDLTNAQPSETQSPSNWNESSEEIVQGKVQQLADALWGTITRVGLSCRVAGRQHGRTPAPHQRNLPRRRNRALPEQRIQRATHAGVSSSTSSKPACCTTSARSAFRIAFCSSAESSRRRSSTK